MSYQTDAVKLREYLEALLREQRGYFDAKFLARDEATRVAYEAMNKRLDGMNEFREALKDQAGLMLPRSEFAVVCDRTRQELAELQKFRHIAEGKASQTSVLIFGFLSVVSLIITIIRMFTG